MASQLFIAGEQSLTYISYSRLNTIAKLLQKEYTS